MDETDELAALIPALLGALDTLALFARRFEPGGLSQLARALEAPTARLAELARPLEDWPDRLAEVRDPLRTASGAAVAGLQGLAAAGRTNELADVFRALGHAPRAQEALYPLAARLPPVSRFFLDPAARGDAALQAALAAPSGAPEAGLVHAGGEPGARGGWSAYAPEYYSADRAWPLVVALHGGSGNGRSFLWSWLAAARSYGALLIAPTAVGRTWALNGPDPDTPNLAGILEWARARWRVDPGRILLAGMSDGGTFAYVTGLAADSPFTHLAPTSAAFHPMLIGSSDAGRTDGLPIRIVHGVRDWMFPVEMAREAAAALRAAGAAVTFREIADLGHAFPREECAPTLAWLRSWGELAPGSGAL